MNEIPGKQLVYDLNWEAFKELFQSWKEPAYRADQIWDGIYRQLWSEPMEFSNTPISLRKKLSEYFVFQSLNPVLELNSIDRETTKVLFEHHDNLRTETVLMRYRNRRTLCISTQVGCAMGCVFCATGQMGFSRNLSSGEIIEQVLHFSRVLKRSQETLTNIVVMGMGEPFHNYDNTMEAIDILNHPEGFRFGERRFTVSTVGIIPRIVGFAREKRQINLAISLHAADDELRSKIIPINKKYPLNDLIDACRYYFLETHRRVSFEWALIKNLNDSSEQATKLSRLVGGIPCHVNIILLNPSPKYMAEASDQIQAEKFISVLRKNNIPCTIRVRRGMDIQAGCGQLAAHANQGFSRS